MTYVVTFEDWDETTRYYVYTVHSSSIDLAILDAIEEAKNKKKHFTESDILSIIRVD